LSTEKYFQAPALFQFKGTPYPIPMLPTVRNEAMTDQQKWVDMREGFNVKDMETQGILFAYFFVE
jgi:hypothetical protein